MTFLKFEFGGLVLGLSLEDGIEVQPWPYVFYMPFRSQKKADIMITAKKVRDLPLPASDANLIFDGDTYWKLFSSERGFLMTLYDPKDHVHNKSVSISKDFKTAEIFLQGTSWYVNDILRPLAEILTVQYLSSRQGLLIHGAAIRDHDRGYLFIGYSGAGKTTTSQLWGALEGDISVLGDERVIVRKDEEGWHVYGTPWAGMGFVVANERVPISNIFFIRHGKKNEIVSPSKAVLFQDLFTQVFAPFWNSETMIRITNTCEKLIEEIPAYQLPFVNNPSVTQFVRDFTHVAH